MAFGEESVTDARRSVGLPHDGQNFREESLQILYHRLVPRIVSSMTDLLEASVAAKNPSLYTIDLLAFDTHEVETHLEKDILHGEIGRHASNTDLCCRLLRFVASTIVWHKLQCA